MKKRFVSFLLVIIVCMSSMTYGVFASNIVIGSDKVRLEGEAFDSYTVLDGVKKPSILMNNPTGTSGGKYVGDYMEGTVLLYEVNVEKAGMYQFDARVAGLNAGAIKISTDSNENYFDNFPSTGDWQNYINVELNIWLEAGNHIIKVENIEGTWNLDYMDIQFLSSEKIERSILDDALIKGSMSGIENLIDGDENTSWKIADNKAIVTLRYDQEYDVSLLSLKHKDNINGEIQITLSNGNQVSSKLENDNLSTDIVMNEKNVSWLRIDFMFEDNVNELQDLNIFGKLNSKSNIGKDILLDGFASGSQDKYFEKDEIIDSFVVEGDTIKFTWANSRIINTIKFSSLPTGLGDNLSGELVYGNKKLEFNSKIVNGTSEIKVDDIDVLNFELHIKGLQGTNDLGVIQIFSNNLGTISTANYDNIILTNRWKSDVLVEHNGQLEYVKQDNDISNEINHTWKLEQIEGNNYNIKNLETETYVYLPENTAHEEAVKMVKDVNNDIRGQWRLEKNSGYLMFYSVAEPNRALAVEHQNNIVTACPEALVGWYSTHWSVSSAVKMEDHVYTIDGNKIYGTAGEAIAYTPKSIISNADGENKTWTLSTDISALPQFKSNTTIVDAVYNLSLEESVKNQFEGKYGIVFNTGVSWNKVWTRDTAMSINYSLGWLYPEYSMNCVKEKIINTPAVFEQDTGTGGSYPTSVDKIIMALPVWDIYLTTGDKDFLNEIYPVIKNTIEQDDHVALEKETGLYLGETGGLDHRAKTYPDWMDENEYDSIVNIAESKSSIVNIIYARVFKILSEAGKVLNKSNEEISYWNQRYEEMKSAINKYFWMEDRGMYASFLYPEHMGAPMADKVDVISNGYALMFDIANDEQKAEIVKNYPIVTYGAPTVWPQKNGIKASYIYHNRGVWPGWEAALMIGAKENGNNQLAEQIWSSCIRGAAMCLTNKEVINYANGKGSASDRQLWSIAGTISGYYRVLFGMEYLEEGLQLTPYAPEWLDGPFELTNYKYRDALLNIKIQGKGDEVESYKINGVEMPKDYIIPSDAKGEYNIEIVMKDSGKRESVNITDQSWVTCPDMPEMTIEDNVLYWESEPGLVYKLWNGEAYVDVTGKNSYDISQEKGYHVYSLMSINENGISSELSKPIYTNTEEKIKIEAEKGNYDKNKFDNKIAGYSGDGCVVDKRESSSPLEIEVEIPKGKAGNYRLNVYYNNKGDATTTTNCAIRSLYVDEKDMGTLIFPLVNVNFDRSTTRYVYLDEGKHILKICYDTTNWYDKNMNENGRNDVSYDYIELDFLGDEKQPDIKYYTQTIEKTQNGNIITSVPGNKIEENASVTYTFVPNEGYFVKEARINDNLIELNNNTYTISSVDKDILVSAIFEKIAPADKTALKIALDLANAITDEDLENVVPVVVNEFKQARNQANEVYNDVSASQDKVDATFDRLASIMQKLEFFKGDKTVLKAFIDKVSGLEAAKYTEATWTPFNDALKAATDVYNDENAMQEEVNNAYNELVTAFLKLRLIPDKSLLEDLINQANGLNSANYTKATFDGLTKALNEAKAVFNNPNATQVEVDNAKAELEKAMADLQTVKAPVNNGDTTVSVKTGDDGIVGVFTSLGLMSIIGLALLRKKEK